MIRILIVSLLIPTITFAQAKKQTTLKESVEQVKTSAKEFGNLFKSKEKKEQEKQQKIIDSLKNLNVTDSSISDKKSDPRVTENVVEDSLLAPVISNMIVNFIISENKPENPKITKTAGSNYFDLQLDFGQGMRSTFYFSTLKQDHAIGDLSNDGKKDLVLKLYSNTGGNSDYLDLCVLTQSATGWKLMAVHSSSEEEIKGCDIGQFIPLTIENGLLIGESLCFTETDPRCCPSLKYKTTLKWINNELKFVKTEKL